MATKVHQPFQCPVLVPYRSCSMAEVKRTTEVQSSTEIAVVGRVFNGNFHHKVQIRSKKVPYRSCSIKEVKRTTEVLSSTEIAVVGRVLNGTFHHKVQIRRKKLLLNHNVANLKTAVFVQLDNQILVMHY